MHKKRIYYLITLFSILLSTSCRNEGCDGIIETKTQLNIVAYINDSYASERVSKTLFQSNDLIGLYLVDYIDGKPQKVGAVNNFMNSCYIYTDNYWQSNEGENLYLTDNTTIADLYGYFPYDYEMSRVASKKDLTAYPFSVHQDQRDSSVSNDFLWGKSLNISAANANIQFEFKHLMSKIIINVLIDNDSKTGNSLHIHNLIKDATIDMNTGIVTPTGKSAIITPYEETQAYSKFDKTYSAIVIPQSVQAGTALFSIEFDNQTLTFLTEDTLILQQGFSYTFNLTVTNAFIDNRTKTITKRLILENEFNY